MCATNLFCSCSCVAVLFVVRCCSALWRAPSVSVVEAGQRRRACKLRHRCDRCSAQLPVSVHYKAVSDDGVGDRRGLDRVGPPGLRCQGAGRRTRRLLVAPVHVDRLEARKSQRRVKGSVDVPGDGAVRDVYYLLNVISVGAGGVVEDCDEVAYAEGVGRGVTSRNGRRLVGSRRR